MSMDRRRGALVELASQVAGAAFAKGSFKSVHALANTGYLAAALLKDDVTEAQMRDVLGETALQLRLRRKGLEDKLHALTAGGPYLGGGKHIVKTVGFDAGPGVRRQTRGVETDRLGCWRREEPTERLQYLRHTVAPAIGHL